MRVRKKLGEKSGIFITFLTVPIGERQVGMGLVVELVQIDFEPRPAAAVAVHSSVLLTFLIILFCFLHLIPTNCTAAAESLYAAAAEILGLVSCWFNCAEFIDSLLVIPRHTCMSMSFPSCPHHLYDFFGNHF